MVDEIVKYSNQFNRIALRGFRARELDLLMAISSRVRERESETVVFTFEQLRELIKESRKGDNEEFAEIVTNVNAKLLRLNFSFKDGSKTIQFALFNEFITDSKEASLSVEVNKKFSFLLNKLDKEFTRFELEQFVDLKSTYAKECYRRLKQFRSTGVWRVSLEEFRRLLDIPPSYSTGHITQKVLTPIKKELGSLLGLKVRLVRTKTPNKPGPAKITKLVFNFNPEKIPGGEKPSKQIIKESGVCDLLEILANELNAEYTGRHVKLSDGTDDTFSTYKIVSISYYGVIGVAVTVKNSDTGRESSYCFTDENHIMNWLEKNLI